MAPRKPKPTAPDPPEPGCAPEVPAPEPAAIAPAETAPAAGGGASALQARFDAEHAQGHTGVRVDPTPNENYSVKGVTTGAPTPETDEAAAQEVAEHAKRRPR